MKTMEERQTPGTAGKKPYKGPALTDYGNLTSLTQGGRGTSAEASRTPGSRIR